KKTLAKADGRMEGRKEGKSRSPKPEQSEPPVSALNLQMINWANLPVDALNGVTAPELRLLTHLSSADHRDDDDLSRFIAYLEDPGQNDDDILGVILPEVGPDGVPKVGAEKEMDEAEVQSLPKTNKVSPTALSRSDRPRSPTEHLHLYFDNGQRECSTCCCQLRYCFNCANCFKSFQFVFA
ncbi:hypothetical protein BOX15_Mlig034198g1, partial [Macrostomum lignano]